MSGELILIVDDHPANLKLVRVLLEAEGFEIKTAIDAGDALQVLKECLPQMILMDIQLPGMDGLTLARQIKTDPLLREVAIVALTAYAMKGDAERARSSGCCGYITKPINTRNFGAVISRYLTASKSEKSTDSLLLAMGTD